MTRILKIQIKTKIKVFFVKLYKTQILKRKCKVSRKKLEKIKVILNLKIESQKVKDKSPIFQKTLRPKLVNSQLHILRHKNLSAKNVNRRMCNNWIKRLQKLLKMPSWRPRHCWRVTTRKIFKMSKVKIQKKLMELRFQETCLSREIAKPRVANV